MMSAQSMKDQMESFFFGLHVHDFPEEICVAGGTVFVHVSGRRQFNLKGGCATLSYFLWHGETKVSFLHVLFQTKYKQTKRNPQLMSDTVM